jgi:hypothetical protein
MVLQRQYLERIELDQPYKKSSVSAFVVYETLTQVPMADKFFKTFTSVLTEKQKQDYRDKLGVDSKILNNIKPHEIAEHLNLKLMHVEPKMSILEMVKHLCTFHSPTYKWGVETDVAVIFVLLDIVGNWKIK